jgi:hypothetical protein
MAITLFNDSIIVVVNCMTYFGWIAKDRSDIFPIGRQDSPILGYW